MGRVDGKIALVTGGASGLGRASADLLAREGATVVIADINLAGAEAVARDIGAAAETDVAALGLDVVDEQNWRSLIDDVNDRFGGLNVLLNSAGIGITKDIEATTYEEWRKVHDIDLDGVFLGCKYAIPVMAASGGGSIINISSISGIIAGHNMAAYNSAKAGVRLLSKSVALHCARKGYNIRCNSLHPTFIDTPILDPIAEKVGSRSEALNKLARQVPLGRVGRPEDIAYAVLYLASDESTFMTGSEMILDGGISAM